MARPMEMRKAFARRLIEALNDAGIPEHEHASYLGMIVGTNAELPKKWLSALTTPTRTTLSHIATRLKVRPAWLLVGSGLMR